MKDLGVKKQILDIEYIERGKIVSSCFHNRSMSRKYL